MSLPLNQVILGDCVEVMAEWPENSVDTIVTDPPYGISFMGKEWDRALPPRAAFEQMIRVLKPGALAFVMSSPRQDVLWRMLALLEGVGFQLKTSAIFWIYRTGFPKAYDVSKGIDRKLGVLNQRKVVGHYSIPSDSDAGNAGKEYSDMPIEGYVYQDPHRDTRKAQITEPVSDMAKKWEGWKSQTSLKPAVELCLMVNKPRSEPTIVDNVLRWGTGAVNVDACRIPFQGEADKTSIGWRKGVGKNGLKTIKDYWITHGFSGTGGYECRSYDIPKGRFPANLLVSDGALDTGETTGGGVFKKSTRKRWASWHETMGRDDILRPHEAIDSYGDEGSPYRFFDLDAWGAHHGFLDVAKPSRAERDFGLGHFPLKHAPIGNYEGRDLENPKNIMRPGMQDRKARNIHPTCKPVKLMAYLIELGCPPKGIVVDPFLGSGTTCIAAKRLRRNWIGIEINPEYAEIAEARINIRGPLDQFMEAEK